MIKNMNYYEYISFITLIHKLNKKVRSLYE